MEHSIGTQGFSEAATLEDILAHAGWMRQLALTLVRTPDRADDVVQDALLVAIERPPRHGGSLRGWLSRVVRHRATDLARAETRRGRREANAEPRASTATPEELTQEAELHRTLLAAVLVLEEPYRSSVLQRFYHGKTSAEIARAEGIPGATVRTRLKRALEQLRGSLDQEYEGRDQHWSALVLPVAKLTSARAALAPGMWLLMGAADVLAILGVGGWMVTARAVEKGGRLPVAAVRTPASPSSESFAAARAFPPEQPSGGGAAESTRAPAVSLAAAALSPVMAVVAREGATGASTTTLRGQVFDAATGDVVPGATVALYEREFVTDASGRYVIPDLPFSHPTRLQVVKEGFVEFFEPIEELVEPETEWNVGLQRGSAALITVRDRQSGDPIEGVELRRKSHARLGVTDELGQLELRVESDQELCLVASRQGFVDLTWWCTIREVEDAATIALPMTAFGWVDVRVVDENGRLAPRSQVGAWFEDGRIDGHPERSNDPETGYPGQTRQMLAWDLASTTAPYGTCTLPVHPSDDPQIVSVTREDGSRARSAPFFVRDSGARTSVVVTFQPVGSIQGWVHYNGEPMAKALVTLTLGDGEIRRARSDHQGHYHAKDIPPGEVLVQLDLRHGLTRPAPQPVEVVAGDAAIHDIDWVEELVTMRGKVVCFDGSPAAGCHVRALRSNTYGWSESFTATTDDAGVFTLQARAGEPYTVSARHEGVRVSRDGVAPDDPSVELTLDASGWIRVRLTDAATNEGVTLKGGAEHTSVAWNTDTTDAYRWSMGNGTAQPDGSYLFQVAARSPSSTASLRVHFSERGYCPTTVSGIVIGATESEATPVEVRLTRGFQARITFQGPEPMTNERRGLHRWFVLREDQADFVRGPFPDQSGASNMRIGKVNMWLESPTLMNQMPAFDDPDVAYVNGLAPGRYTLRSFPEDFTFEPEWFELSEGDPEVEITWSER